MKKTGKPKRRLKLRREQLRHLSATMMTRAVGGSSIDLSCGDCGMFPNAREPSDSCIDLNEPL